MNLCPKCQSFGQCAGTCWLLDVARKGEWIDSEMAKPEVQERVRLWDQVCVPVVRSFHREGYADDSRWVEDADSSETGKPYR